MYIDDKFIRKSQLINFPYVGGKRKIARQLIGLFKTNFDHNLTVYDLFGGGGSVTFEALINGYDVVYNDISDLPIRAIKKVLNETDEFLLSLYLTPDEFKELRKKKDIDEVDYLKLIVNSFGYNCTNYLQTREKHIIEQTLMQEIINNGGNLFDYRNTKEFKKYREIYGTDKMQTIDRIRILKRLKDSGISNYFNKPTIYNKDYKEFQNVKGALIYLDPPYHGTLLKKAFKRINREEFLDFAVNMSKNNIVLINEYNISDDRFELVHEFKKSMCSIKGGKDKTRYDKLYMVKNE